MAGRRTASGNTDRLTHTLRSKSWVQCCSFSTPPLLRETARKVHCVCPTGSMTLIRFSCFQQNKSTIMFSSPNDALLLTAIRVGV